MCHAKNTLSRVDKRGQADSERKKKGKRKRIVIVWTTSSGREEKDRLMHSRQTAAQWRWVSALCGPEGRM